jgi:two-component system sensor histidine kinase CpxA
MRSLFLKIFLSYWMALALFLVLAILATLAMRPATDNSSLQAQQNKLLADTVQAYQSGGEEVARKFAHNVRDSQHARLYLFDDQDRELLGHAPPEWILRVQRGQIHTADSWLGRLRPMQFLRPSMTASNGQRYSMVIELPPEPHGLFGPHGVPGLGILIAVLSSGLVCYLLARYLTAPIVQLRVATQKLAAGDLTARAGTPDSRRHDEIADLVRDFDRMAGRLQNLVNAQARLLTDISHELRSPLARLSVALELARQRSGPDAISSLDRIDRETTRVNELIQRLLTISRLEAAESIEKFPVDLQQIIQEIARDAAFEAQVRHCQVETIYGESCVVLGNPAFLHSAIENVVRNAIRYTQEGSCVQVRLQRGSEMGVVQAVVRVTDEGPGVPDDALDKLFRPFYRIDDARGRHTGGVGLGLAITERAVLLHGGTVKAANGPQGGLIVEIRLPLAPETADITSLRASIAPVGDLS